MTGLSPDHDVIVGVSGGVDSAVALKLVQDSGCRVSALFMKNWEEDDDGEYCAAAQDLEDARRVCAHLGVELKTVNLAAEYWDRVFTGFLESYRDGKTPNPDVLCNREIKFRSFMEFAGDYGADIMATGHYARLRLDGGRHRLLKGADPDKDQSYFLCLLDQSQLARAVFPLGELYKTSVRHLARRHALHNHARRDSTGICFIGERPFRQFLSRYLPPDPGSIESDTGRCLGQHEGLMYYTIGQRQGLGIGGEPGGSGQPWYVASKDFDTNTLVVVQGRDHPLLFAGALTAIDAHWIAGEPPAMPLRCRAKIRYRQPDQPCSVESGADGRLLVRFDTPQWAVTPGQMVVFYQDEECLGGASILGPGG